MKLFWGLLNYILFMIFLSIAWNVKIIWPNQPESHIQFQELAWCFGAGVFFTMGLYYIVEFIKDQS